MTAPGVQPPTHRGGGTDRTAVAADTPHAPHAAHETPTAGPLEHTSRSAAEAAAAAERKPKVNSWMWVALAAGATVLALLAARRLTGQRRPTLGDVIADGLAETWSRRFGVPQDRIQSALRGHDSALQDRIGDQVCKVSCAFRQEPDAERRHLVQAVLDCDYRDGGSERVTMRTPWRRIPSGVRNELLQPGMGEAVRSWTPV